MDFTIEPCMHDLFLAIATNTLCPKCGICFLPNCNFDNFRTMTFMLKCLSQTLFGRGGIHEYIVFHCIHVLSHLELESFAVTLCSVSQKSRTKHQNLNGINGKDCTVMLSTCQTLQ